VATAERTYAAGTVVNATGPWIDEVNAAMGLPSRFHIRKVSGIHLLVDRPIAFPLFLQAQYPRIFFMIPDGRSTIVGTTERSEETPMSAVRIHPDDVAYLLAQANRYFKEPIGKADIADQWIGVRALVASSTNLSRMTREAEIDVHRTGRGKVLAHVFGGKLTSAVALARKVKNALSSAR
jgi:glycerol-3-phosphate dehydrogenase